LSDFAQERARREDKVVAKIAKDGRYVLTTDYVMPEVPEMGKRFWCPP